MGHIAGTSSLRPPTASAALTALRVERGLTREDLAARAGLSARTLYSAEHGRHQPHRATLRALAFALDCAVAELQVDERPGEQTEPFVTNSAEQGRDDARAR